MSVEWAFWLVGLFAVVLFATTPYVAKWLSRKRKERADKEIFAAVPRRTCVYHPDRESVDVNYDTDGDVIFVCRECDDRLIRMREVDE